MSADFPPPDNRLPGSLPSPQKPGRGGLTKNTLIAVVAVGVAGVILAAYVALLRPASAPPLSGESMRQEVAQQAARQPVPTISSHVIDTTGTLTADQAKALEAKLAAFKSASGAALVVLMVPTTQPEDIAGYAQRAVDSWRGVNQPGGDWSLLLLAKDDRKLRIEVGSRLKDSIPDAIAKRIIDEDLVPHLKRGAFDAGINSGVDQLIAAMQPRPSRAAAIKPAKDGAQYFLRCSSEAVLGLISDPVNGVVLITDNRNPGPLEIDVKKFVVKTKDGYFTPECYQQPFLGGFIGSQLVRRTVPAATRDLIILDSVAGCLRDTNHARFARVQQITYEGSPMCAVSEENFERVVKGGQIQRLCDCGETAR